MIENTRYVLGICSFKSDIRNALLSLQENHAREWKLKSNFKGFWISTKKSTAFWKKMGQIGGA